MSDESEALKAMLEGGEETQTPLAEFDPAALDELVHRIDSGYLRLGLVPDPSLIDALVSQNRALRAKFNFEFEQNPKPRARRQKIEGAEAAKLLKDVEVEF
jgi:hypothetical protein